METRPASQLVGKSLIHPLLFSLSRRVHLLSTQPLQTHAPPPPGLVLTPQMEV